MTHLSSSKPSGEFQSCWSLKLEGCPWENGIDIEFTIVIRACLSLSSQRNRKNICGELTTVEGYKLITELWNAAAYGDQLPQCQFYTLVIAILLVAIYSISNGSKGPDSISVTTDSPPTISTCHKLSNRPRFIRISSHDQTGHMQCLISVLINEGFLLEWSISPAATFAGISSKDHRVADVASSSSVSGLILSGPPESKLVSEKMFCVQTNGLAVKDNREGVSVLQKNPGNFGASVH